MDEACWKWFCHQCWKGAAVSGVLLQGKVCLFFVKLSPDTDLKSFKGSAGRQAKFHKCHGIKNSRLQGGIMSLMHLHCTVSLHARNWKRCWVRAGPVPAKFVWCCLLIIHICPPPFHGGVPRASAVNLISILLVSVSGLFTYTNTIIIT